MKNFMRIVRGKMPIVLLLVLVGFALPSARAQTCQLSTVDSANGVYENACIMTEGTNIFASAEVSTQNYDYVPMVAAAANLFDNFGLVAWVGPLCTGGQGYGGFSSPCPGGGGGGSSNPDIYVGTEATYDPTQAYTLDTSYGECYDSSGQGGLGPPEYGGSCGWEDGAGPTVGFNLIPTPSGFINPKYAVVGVTYAPPGSSSSVTYTGTTSVGNTANISSSYTYDAGFSVSVAGKLGVPVAGIVGGGVSLTFSESTDYSQQSNSSNTTTITKASTVSYQTGGTPTASPVNNDYDYIWLWLNPELLFSYTAPSGSNPASLQFTGYAMDGTDPATGEPQPGVPYVGGPDLLEVQVGCLNGDFSCPSALVVTNGVVTQGTLARSWADNEYTWPAGDGPALTVSDICAILTFDPLATVSTSLCPNYQPYTLLSSFPSATSDNGRFTKEPYPPNPIQYPVGGGVEGYSTVQTDTQTTSNGASNTIKQSFGASQQFGTNFFDIFSSTTTMKESLTLTWVYSWLNTLTTTTTLTDALSVKGPPDGTTYTGPDQFLAYQDNLFGTFAFVPLPY